MRLSQNTALQSAIKHARYQREQHRVGIVHLGIGAFHRAHQAWYTEQVLAQFGGHWRITGVSLRSERVHAQLAPQDCLYTLEIRDGAKRERQLIGAIANILVAPKEPENVIAALAAADTSVVTLTITEKGYYLAPSTGELAKDHIDLQHDREHIKQPRTALGFLTAAMAERRQQQRPGLTVISCDNMSTNGKKLRQALLEFSRIIDPTLADWIAKHCRFPNTMVDRIVPATTPDDLRHLEHELGLEDQGAVFSEPFSQWIIEDNFAGPVPQWNKVGVQYVADVTPFENMKLRLLNASHSAIAYIGAVAGYNTVDQVIAKPSLHRFIEKLMQEEAAPTLRMPATFDLNAYQQNLLQRFANSALQHQCQQIAIDGSQKIPNRLFPILRWQLQYHGSISLTTAALAAWVRYLQGVDEFGNRYSIEDPMAAQFAAIFKDQRKSARTALVELRQIETLFPADIASNDKVFSAIDGWLKVYEQQGINHAIQDFLLTSKQVKTDL
ncbi:Polyol:NADP oxidoreductase [Zhongshania aliphaticivorans]|uniref:Polyol:NADP oxidoreductase n=1 Tax=Zhongshania aliphaticivorans TaxID=1470434 RepID=A0A5S9NSK1_9GAMM|nr:mannitol dehydrogenase family protein [Zhongshania aliphaticivorans]CAA0093600.1 Polyol:NADP oxidoreductase [Zhongshania aliphaticivorans]CAA0111589.1 Polyol:NADP oxidoreductase [Zhongshania aliphaticivorans]